MKFSSNKEPSIKLVLYTIIVILLANEAYARFCDNASIMKMFLLVQSIIIFPSQPNKSFIIH